MALSPTPCPKHVCKAATARGGALVLSLALLLAACTTTPRVAAPVAPAEVGEIWPGYGVLKGYLARTDLPDSLGLLPAPPQEGSAAFEADKAGFAELTAFQATPRGALAARDAASAYPGSLERFSCALGLTVTQAETPHLAMLMRRTQGDAILAPYAAKDRYKRIRPFAFFKAPSCVPADEALLATDGSYPSGHASVGWAWALVLSEVAPDRSDALLQRGRAYAQSRAICGVHWKSDIEAGRLVGAATVARLHADPVFMAQRDAARSEVAAWRKQGGKAAVDCAAEAAALAPTAGIAP